MNTQDASIKESLSNAHQGAVLSAVGAFSDKFKSLFTEPAKHVSTLVSRLGVGTAAVAIGAMALVGAPEQAQAQQYWANAAPWATSGNNGGSNSLNDAFRQQRQVDLAAQAARVIAEQRGLDSKGQNLANLASLAGGAFSNGSKAPLVAGVLGAGAAMLIPNGQNGNILGNNGGNSGGWLNAAPWGNSGGGYSNANYGYGQQGNAQTQAVQQAFARYQQLAEPQFQLAVQANLDGQLAVRDAAIVKFGNHWNAASQMGIPLSNSPDQVAKFQMLGRMNQQALQYGLQTRVTAQPQLPHNPYGMQ